MDRRLTFMAFGVVLWLVGVIVIRVAGPWFFDAGWRHVLFFALNFVVGGATVALVARMTGRTRQAMVVPTVIIAMVAMLLDGLAVTLDAAGITHIYADTPRMAAYAGGLLLFAFWSALAFALYWHQES